MFPIRLTQAVFAIITLGLAGYVIHWYTAVKEVPEPSPSQFNILIFNALFTFLSCLYLTISPVYYPEISHKYIVLGLDGVIALFWFASFIAMGVFLGGLESCIGDVCGSAKAAVVLGAFEWVLFMATSILAGMHVWRTRNSIDSKPAPQQPIGARTGRV